MVKWFVLGLLALFVFVAIRSFLQERGGNRHHRSMRRQARQALRKMRATMAGEPGRIFGYLRTMHPHAVEELVLQAAEDAGHRVKRNKRYTGDGGVDGRIRLGRTWHLVQVKRYRDAIRPLDVVGFSAVCRSHGLPGLFIHCGRTGPMSVDAARDAQNVRFVSGDGLVKLVQGDALAA